MAALPHINEQLVASRVIVAAAGTAATRLDTFSNWLMLGYAAAIGLLLDKGDKYLPSPAFHRLIELFLWVAVLGIIAKYLSVAVSGASAGTAIGREAVSGVGELNLEPLARQMLRGLPQPARFFTRRMLAKAMAGDLLSSSRLFFCLAQVQGALTMLQAACVIVAIYTVYDSATFGGGVAAGGPG
jgi:hypothetical protein